MATTSTELAQVGVSTLEGVAARVSKGSQWQDLLVTGVRTDLPVHFFLLFSLSCGLCLIFSLKTLSSVVLSVINGSPGRPIYLREGAVSVVSFVLSKTKIGTQMHMRLRRHVTKAPKGLEDIREIAVSCSRSHAKSAQENFPREKL